MSNRWGGERKAVLTQRRGGRGGCFARSDPGRGRATERGGIINYRTDPLSDPLFFGNRVGRKNRNSTRMNANFRRYKAKIDHAGWRGGQNPGNFSRKSPVAEASTYAKATADKMGDEGRGAWPRRGSPIRTRWGD